MDILHFIRLLFRNAVLLILAPLVLAILVFFMTRNEVRSYTSETMVYTGLASGYSIESQGDSKVDFFGTNIAFDNLINVIKMKTTVEEVSLRLLAQHLSLNRPSPEYISTESWNELQRIVPQEVQNLVIKGNEQKTYQNLVDYKNSNFTNFVYLLLSKDHPHYSIKSISSINVRRVANSDIIKLQFEQNDPGICYHTLEFLNVIFTKNHSRIKENQTDAVVNYFEDQMRDAGKYLANAEDKLLLFNQKNKIINYYEQTRYIASKKEELAVEVQHEKMDLQAAKAAIDRLDRTVKQYKKLNLTTQSVLQLRDRLSEVTSKLAMLEVGEGFNQQGKKEGTQEHNAISAEAIRVKQQLASEVEKLYNIQNSQEGIVSSKVLDDWLANVILYEEKRARLAILMERSKEFTETYNRFAPLGATLKRIEREIEVAEKKYLSLLHSLAMAKLKQQNVELSSNVKVMDPPQFPIEPLPSKRMVMVAVAFIAGFMMLFVFVIAMEYLDTTLKTSVAAEHAIGKRVAAVLPMVLPDNEQEYYSVVLNRSFDMLIKDLKLKRIALNNKKPLLIQLFSTRKGDGKSFTGKHLCDHLAKLNHSVLFINGGLEESMVYTNNQKEVTISNEALKDGSLLDFIQTNKELFASPPEYLIIEIPPDEFRSYMVEIQSKVDLSYLVVRSNREWSTSDRKYLAQYDHIMDEGDVEVILNGVKIEVMEQEVGEIPKPRTFLRSFAKRIVKLQFFKRQVLDK